MVVTVFYRGIQRGRDGAKEKIPWFVSAKTIFSKVKMELREVLCVFSS
jgi:hypothetical protein